MVFNNFIKGRDPALSYPAVKARLFSSCDEKEGGAVLAVVVPISQRP